MLPPQGRHHGQELRKLAKASGTEPDSYRDRDIGVGAQWLLLPSQYYGESKRIDPVSRRAMDLQAAVLQRAIGDYLGTSGSSIDQTLASKRRYAEDAERWIFDDGGRGPFAFREVCLWLGIDPEGLRDRMRRLKAKGKWNILRTTRYGRAHQVTAA